MPSIATPRYLYTYCPLCKSSSFKAAGSHDCHAHPLYDPVLPNVINWQECDSCGHSFTDGYFTEDALKGLFSRAHEYQLLNAENVERFRFRSARRLDRIASVLGKQEGKWLEVGLGDGSLMTTCEEFGFEPIGFDLRSEAVERIKQFGYEAHCMDFNNYRQFEDFAVISMADVLEHMRLILREHWHMPIGS